MMFRFKYHVILKMNLISTGLGIIAVKQSAANARLQ
jgi:hypothetical protein